MNTSKNSTTWRAKRARLAAGLIVVAIAAAGAGVSASGAGASNGWGRSVQTTTKTTAIVAPVTAPAESLVTSSNGWG